MEQARTLVSYEQFCWMLDLGLTLKFRFPNSPYVQCVHGDVSFENARNNRIWCYFYYEPDPVVCGDVAGDIPYRHNTACKRQDLFEKLKDLDCTPCLKQSSRS